jgi:transcription elongation factor SPT5
MVEKFGPQANLPSVDDPKLWQVRVKKKFERTACNALLRKSIDLAQKGQPLSILSVTCSDTTEGYVFVEAFKEIHVRQAIEGLHFMLQSVKLVPTEEMPVIYQIDKAKSNEIRKHQWVRVKNSGPYKDDIALVEKTDDAKVWVRLIPRVDLTAAAGLGTAPKGKARFNRIPQR